MTHASLFTGIGGFDLAARWMGWVNLFQCEWDAWCISKLEKNFPDVQHRYKDIREFDARAWHGKVDVLSGGFPCQPYSVAGQRRGTADERHLWPEMLRVIQEAAPRYVVAENVRGLLNWADGLVFEQVQSDLEAAGYEVAPFVLPAASAGATHERQRIWIVAHLKSHRRQGTGDTRRGGHGLAYSSAFGSYTDREWQQQSQRPEQKKRRRLDLVGEKTLSHPNSQRRGQLITSSITDSPRQSCSRNYDCWDEWTTEPAVCRVVDGIPNRLDRIRGLGNAIVPQIAYRIFLAIAHTDTITHNI